MGLRLSSRKNFWLLSVQDESSVAQLNHTHPSDVYRLKTAGAAQGIYYPPGSIGECLHLLRGFRELGKDWPSVDDARRVFESLQHHLSHYEFHSEERLWYIRNCGEPVFSDPFNGCNWGFLQPVADGIPFRCEFSPEALIDVLGLFPYLNGNESRQTVESLAGESDSRSCVLNRFDQYGVLEDVSANLVEPNLANLPELLFLGHSSLMIHDGRTSVVIDPMFIDDSTALQAADRDPYFLTQHADIVLFSHHHWDHFHYTALARIPRDKLIIVPKTQTATLMNPPMKIYLEVLGFTQVRECEPGDEVVVGDIKIRLWPFYGECFGLDSRFDAFTYYVEFGGKTLYGTVDAWRDEVNSMESVIEEVAQIGPLDFLLFGSSNQHHNPGYVAAAPRHLSNELTNAPDLLRYHPNVSDVARWAQVLKPRLLIPYAEFVFTGVRVSDINLDSAGGDDHFRDYWESLNGLKGVSMEIRRWEHDLKWLISQTTSPLQVLHPLQGVFLSAR